jgi:bifunctional non-homologous end joining protein LigD
MKAVKPMLAYLAKEPFDREGWLYETKWDGYRVLAYKGNQVNLLSRGQKSFNAQFPMIAEELKKLPGHFILDGEIVILDAKGKSNFQLLQNYQRRKQGTPYCFFFDILSFEGQTLTSLPLVDRKLILKTLLESVPLPHIKFSEHVMKKGTAFFRKAVKLGLEGIIAKRADSPYQFHRSRDWLKIKTSMRQEVVIGGFTKPRGSRKRLGALLVGVYQQRKLVYCGHVGGGFTDKLLEDIYAELQKYTTESCPFVSCPIPNAPVTWVKPKLVCEVSFLEWTEDGIMRQPIFKGMRKDKPAKEVKKEECKA